MRTEQLQICPFPYAFTHSNRELAAALQQPHVRAALTEFRINPVAASAKYESNEEITRILDLLSQSLSVEV